MVNTTGPDGQPAARPVATPPRPRTIITTDPELDDLNSMIRLVLYSNELAIEGLIYASSRYHWKGDGEGTEFFLPDREYDRPQSSWRWAKGERFIDDVLDAYAQVHRNLVVHDPRYPAPEDLRAVVREGNVSFEGDISEESPGSRLIEETLLDDRTGPVHLQVWAGTSTIARALLSIEERYRGTPHRERVRAEVSEKAVITKFDSQDATYDDYIRSHWPDIRVVDVATWAWGYFARRLALPEYAQMLRAEWMREHVTSIGPLGRLYRTWGDGRRMVDGDIMDFFHLSGYSADELRAMGFNVWTDVQAPGEWISEGDTTNMLNLFANGLRGHEHPSYGGWGGRAVPTADGPDEWSVKGAQDHPLDTESEVYEYGVTRWFADAQRDFAGRLRWSVTPAFEQARHHPTVTVAPGVDLGAVPGQSLVLTATVTDPDGGTVSCRWWHYREAGTFPGQVELTDADTPVVTARIPGEAAPGQTLHLILEACNDAVLPLKVYQRVIVTIDAGAEAPVRPADVTA